MAMSLPLLCSRRVIASLTMTDAADQIRYTELFGGSAEGPGSALATTLAAGSRRTQHPVRVRASSATFGSGLPAGRIPIGLVTCTLRRVPRVFTRRRTWRNFSTPSKSIASFYSPLQPGHAHQWLERVAGNPRFLFTAKMWQKFTHETFFDVERNLAPGPARSSASKLSRTASGSTGIA